MTQPTNTSSEQLVPDDVIPHHNLPPLRYRDMPDPIPLRKMMGPSIILAGLALGSGEFILWPHIVYKSGFIFFWACMLGVITQFFLNMEIERWTLATGETAIAGFCRLSRVWAWVMLVLNIIPWAWPGWATGASELISWVTFGPTEQAAADGSVQLVTPYVPHLGIATLIMTGLVLTAGPVVYNTVEKIQTILVALIVILAITIAFLVVRSDAIVAMGRGMLSIGQMPDSEKTGLTLMSLLGALAFAGAGGTMNLSQSNFIRDKGYGMGKYIGRITSPLTGNEEPIADVGYHFPHTPENMSRWRAWWRAANLEHFFSFYLTCVVCLCLMSLTAYSLFYAPDGQLKEGMDRYGSGMAFVWGEAKILGSMQMGGLVKLGFLIMGVAILFTTELGVLDATARVSTDIVKLNFLRNSDHWSLSRLYFVFLWGEIALGVGILLFSILGIWKMDEPLFLLKTSAAMNGGVMFLYSLILLYMNNKILSRDLSMTPLRFVAVVWSCAFFGYFTIQAIRLNVIPFLRELSGV